MRRMQMRKCTKCNIDFNGDIKYCPLCQNKLAGTPSASVFPKNIKRQKDTILFKILFFVTTVFCISSIFMEYVLTKKLEYSIFAVLALITNLILLFFILKNYQNVVKIMTKYFIFILASLLIWFFMTKSLTITTYVIPGLCILIFLFNSIAMLVFKNYYIDKYSGVILVDAIIGLIPMVFVLLNLTVFNIPAYICLLLDIFIFLALIIFCKDRILSEFKKLFSL